MLAFSFGSVIVLSAILSLVTDKLVIFSVVTAPLPSLVLVIDSLAIFSVVTDKFKQVYYLKKILFRNKKQQDLKN